MTNQSTFDAASAIITAATDHASKIAAYTSAGEIARASGNHNVFLSILSALGSDPLAVNAPQRAELRAAAYRGWEG